MKSNRFTFLAVCFAAVVIAAGVFAATAMRTQPAGGNLPPGFSRDAATGALTVTAPPAVQFESDANKAKLASLTSSLSVGSFSLDQVGYVKEFTVNSPLGDYPDGTVLICRSVTLNADGTLDSLVLASNAADTGCDMVVTIDGNVTSYKCNKTTCTTQCDTQSTTDPVTGKVTITCNCRATP